jgi:hypothetical protein
MGSHVPGHAPSGAVFRTDFKNPVRPLLLVFPLPAALFPL